MDRSLQVSALSRVEGEGAMRIRVADGKVEDVQLEIYEPPRFFEALLRGRPAHEAPDITARVCGICPVAYQMSACQAVENAYGTAIPDVVTRLRRLLYCGEWISSHALHIYLLHAPDFLGFDSVVELARADRATVERGLALKKAGNTILETIGGRAIHPVNVRVGGFYKAPDLAGLKQTLSKALDGALATVEWVSAFDFPEFEHDHELLALVEQGRYAIESGVPTTDRGLSFPVGGFERHVVESQVPHSTALHASLAGRGRYMTGPLARFALSRQWLSPLALEAAARAGLAGGCRNPFQSIVVRAVETVYAVEEALRLIEEYEPPAPPAVEVTPRAGVGHGATEAPRGTLFHRYEIDADGGIVSARIVPPTSQNQAAIEHDLSQFVSTRFHLDDHRLTHECEQAIRNYDPCISCATHFLELTVERSGKP